MRYDEIIQQAAVAAAFRYREIAGTAPEGVGITARAGLTKGEAAVSSTWPAVLQVCSMPQCFGSVRGCENA